MIAYLASYWVFDNVGVSLLLNIYVHMSSLKKT